MSSILHLLLDSHAYGLVPTDCWGERRMGALLIGRVERWETPPLHLHLPLVWVNRLRKMLPRGAAPAALAWARGKGWGAQTLGKTPFHSGQ